MPIQFDLVAPERAMATEQATMVVAPGVEGDFGVMEGHAPMLSVLRPGVVTATLTGGDTKRYTVFGGLAEVGPDRCTILADDVHDEAAVTPEMIATRVAAAEKALETAIGDDAPRAAQYLNDLKSLAPAG
ncbi:MAG: ATP synthase F1 subunit epsilon [Pseudomonadota bacterium]